MRKKKPQEVSEKVQILSPEVEKALQDLAKNCEAVARVINFV